MALLQNSLLKGLAAYWPLHEASGDAYDVRGVGLTLTDTNTVTAAEGKVITSRQFTRANTEYLARASEPALQMGDIDFTVAMWVYMSSKPAALMFPIAKDGAGSGQREYSLYWSNTADRFIVQVFQATDVARAVTANNIGSPALSTWYLLMFWHDAAANTINVEGNASGNIDSAATGGALQAVSSGVFNIGNFRSSTTSWDGRICEVGMWRRLLTIQERAWLYNRGLGRTWPFDGTFSPALTRRNPALVRAGVRAPGVISS